MQALLVDAEALDIFAGDGDGSAHGGEFSMDCGKMLTAQPEKAWLTMFKQPLGGWFEFSERNTKKTK